MHLHSGSISREIKSKGYFHEKNVQHEKKNHWIDSHKPPVI